MSSGYDSGFDDDGYPNAGACIFSTFTIVTHHRYAQPHRCDDHLDVIGSEVVRMQFYLKQGDTLPVLEAQLVASDGHPINLQGMQVRFRMGRHVDAPAEIVDGSEGRVRYRWRPGDTDMPGAHKAEFVVTTLGGDVQTVPNSGYVMVMIERAVG